MKKIYLLLAMAMGLSLSFVGANKQISKAKAEYPGCDHPCVVDTITAEKFTKIYGQNNYETSEDDNTLSSQYWLASSNNSIKTNYFTLSSSHTPIATDESTALSDVYVFYSESDVGIVEKVKITLDTSVTSATRTMCTFDVYAKETLYGGNIEFYRSGRCGTKVGSTHLTNENVYEFTFDDANYKSFGIKAMCDRNYYNVNISSIEVTWCNATLDEPVELDYEGESKVIDCEVWGNGQYTLESSNPYVFEIEGNMAIPTGGGRADVLVHVDGHIVAVDGVIVNENITTVTKKVGNNGDESKGNDWEVVTDISQLKSGDIITFAYIIGETTIYTPINVLDEYAWITAEENTVTKTGEFTYHFNNNPAPMMVTGNSSDGWRIYLSNDGALSMLGSTIDKEFDARLSTDPLNYEWIISISDGNIIISNESARADQYFKFDVGEPSFGPTRGSYEPFKLLRYLGNSDVDLAVSDEIDGNSPAVNFAHYLLDCFSTVCDPVNGAGKDAIENAIENLFSSDMFAGLNELSLEMLKLAEANENGDSLQKAMSLYNYLVTTYGIEDTLDRGITPANQNSIKLSDTEASTISIAIIMSAMTLIGPSLLFLKKKKFVK